MRQGILTLATGETTRVVDSGGTLPPLVLVHGLANSIEIWDRVRPQLEKRFRVIAFDLPGFGLASRPDAAYDGPFFSAQLGALLDALHLERAMLVGNSLGASVILRLWARAPHRISRAVLAAPGSFGRKTNLTMRLPSLPVVGSWLGRPTPANNIRTLRLTLNDPANMTPELIALTNRYAAMPGSNRSFVKTLQQGVGLTGSKDRDTVTEIAGSFDRPALVIWGRQDRVFPVEQAHRAATLLPHSELLLLDDCGHYPHWEQPIAFAEAVERYCG